MARRQSRINHKELSHKELKEHRGGASEKLKLEKLITSVAGQAAEIQVGGRLIAAVAGQVTQPTTEEGSAS